MRKQLFVKGVIVAVPILLFFGLLYNYLGLSGEKIVHYTVGDSSPFVQSLLPSDRVSKVENGSVKLLEEPVYFSVFAPPGNWQTADVKIDFQTGDQAILELGVLRDLFAQAFDFKPLANTVVEHLEANGWVGRPLAQLGENVNVFIRKEFVGAPPSSIKDAQIGIYKASLPWSPPPGATASKKDKTYSLMLRGPHELFTAIGDKEPLRISILLDDLNEAVGSDEGAIRIYSQKGGMVSETVFADDGNTTADGSLSPSRTVVVAPDGLPAGTYRIVLSGTSDIVFDEFVTKQNYLVVKNSMTIKPHTGAIALNTNAKKITVEPLAVGALGTTVFGQTKMALEKVNEKVSGVSIDRDVSSLILPGGGVKITGEGFFALANAAFFIPEPAGFSNFLAAPDRFRAIVAFFPPQMRDGHWRTATTKYELSTLAKERGAYKFVISAPLVHETDGGVEIHSIDVTFKKPQTTFRSLFSSLKSFARDLIW